MVVMGMTERKEICRYCTHFQEEYVSVSKQDTYLVKEYCKYKRDVHSESVQCNQFNKKLSHKLKELLRLW